MQKPWKGLIPVWYQTWQASWWELSLTFSCDPRSPWSHRGARRGPGGCRTGVGLVPWLRWLPPWRSLSMSRGSRAFAGTIHLSSPDSQVPDSGRSVHLPVFLPSVRRKTCTLPHPSTSGRRHFWIQRGGVCPRPLRCCQRPVSPGGNEVGGSRALPNSTKHLIRAGLALVPLHPLVPLVLSTALKGR